MDRLIHLWSWRQCHLLEASRDSSASGISQNILKRLNSMGKRIDTGNATQDWRAGFVEWCFPVAWPPKSTWAILQVKIWESQFGFNCDYTSSLAEKWSGNESSKPLSGAILCFSPEVTGSAFSLSAETFKTLSGHPQDPLYWIWWLLTGL